MANALRVRPHVIHRLAERWTLLGRKLRLFFFGLLPDADEFCPVLAGA
jgi:hypothetical protein